VPEFKAETKKPGLVPGFFIDAPETRFGMIMAEASRYGTKMSFTNQ